MIEAIAGLGRAGFSELSVSAAVGELSERLVADVLGGTVARRQNRGSDVVAPDGRTVEVKARIANASNRSNRQFNFRLTSARTDTAYCLTWTLANGSPALDQVIRVRMGLLIGHGKQGSLGSYCARTTHDGLRRLLARFGEIATEGSST